MKCVTIILIFCCAVAIQGCNRKPAYSDIKTDEPKRAAETKAENSETVAPNSNTATDPVAKLDQQLPNSNTATPATPSKTVRPSFLDTSKGEIIDLPRYPNAAMTNIQYGPKEDLLIAFMVFQAYDTVDKVAAFYDKSIKSKGWTVVSRTNDAAFYEWNLKKGESDTGAVKVMFDESNKTVLISLTRTEPNPEKKAQ
ncbi:MAG: hypothetical protein AB1757_14465 [Acidobacteriota bacterium]